jgi:MFS transporter, PPP family, 3-phenylpropionic acid transporter
LADRYGRKRIFTLALAVSALSISGFMLGQSFMYFVLFMLAFTFIYNPMTSLIDSIALDICENDSSVTYGQLRLWASIGWATSTLATGYFIQWVGISYIFVLAAALLTITWAVVAFLYRPITPKNLPKGISPKLVASLIKDNPQLLFFLLLITGFTIFSSPIHLFINLYYSEIGASSQQMGIAFAVQSICELPFFFYGNKIVARYGIKRTFIFTMAVTAVRMLLYSQTANPTLAILIGSSHGICLALYLVSMVSYVHRIVPPHLKSTGQSLIYTAMAAGICAGNLLTGYIQDIASIQSAMLIFFFVVIAISVFVYFMAPRIQSLGTVQA